MGKREAIIKKIAEIIGFPFSERELSPNLRKKIGKLVEKQEYLQCLYHRKMELQEELRAKRFLAWIPAFLGVLVFFFGLLVMLVNKVWGTISIIFSLLLFMSAVLTWKHLGKDYLNYSTVPIPKKLHLKRRA